MEMGVAIGFSLTSLISHHASSIRALTASDAPNATKKQAGHDRACMNQGEAVEGSGRDLSQWGGRSRRRDKERERKRESKGKGQRGGGRREVCVCV